MNSESFFGLPSNIKVTDKRYVTRILPASLFAHRRFALYISPLDII